jgi:DNA-binding transcriptional regulator YiaG
VQPIRPRTGLSQAEIASSTWVKRAMLPNRHQNRLQPEGPSRVLPKPIGKDLGIVRRVAAG